MEQKLKRGNKKSQEEKRFEILAYLEKGWTIKQVASELSCSISLVYSILRKYNLHGDYFLIAKKRGNKSLEKINAEQVEELKSLIDSNLPEKLLMGKWSQKQSAHSFGLWSRDALRKLIEVKFHIEEFSRSQAGRYLKAWGYESQKPIDGVLEQKSEKVKKWFEEKYLAIKERAKEESAVIYFGDETGKGTAQNMISAITNKLQLQFMITKGGINGGSFLTFVRQMRKYSMRKIFLITDNYSEYKTNELDEWLIANKRIEVFFADEPETNSQEQADQDEEKYYKPNREINLDLN